jgi:diketogulonate reductase-like aldo/keto reductase
MNRESYRAMEDLYKQGKIRAIGVSNFLVHHLDELLETATIVPHVNQIRLFPGLRQDEVISYCKEKGIAIEAYSPFGTGKIFEVKELQELASKYNKSIAQICVRYSLDKGYIPLPKSVTPSRIKSNIEVFDFKLDKEDIKLLDNLPNYVSPLKDIDNINY